MGVRFACHACGKRLNIKSELAGRRGICPSCSVRFRIPSHDTATSTPIETGDADGSSDSIITSDGAALPSSAASAAISSVAASQSITRSPSDTKEPAPQPAQPVAPRSAAPTQSLEEILGDGSSTWYVRPPGGGQYGPADGPTLGQWITEGRVADTAMLWRDGWPDWRGAKQVLPIFSGGSATANANAGPPAQPPNNNQASTTSNSTTNNSASGGEVRGSKTAVSAGPVSAGPVSTGPVSTGPAMPDAGLRTGGKVLDTNKKKLSRKRVAVSAVLACVFIVLLVALIFVLRQP